MVIRDQRWERNISDPAQHKVFKVEHGTSLTYVLQLPWRGCVKIRKYVRDELYGQTSDDVELEGSRVGARLDEPPLVWRQVLDQGFKGVTPRVRG